MRIKLWGTRGSMPVPDARMARYGGDTTCVEVRGEDGTLLVLDAGTGIRQLGASLPPEQRRVDILLTHLHLDHIHGLGFFAPLQREDLDIRIWGPPSLLTSLEQRLARYLSPPLFPTRLNDLPSRPEVRDFPRGYQGPGEPYRSVSFGGLEVSAEFVNHPGLTYGYRIHEPATGQTIAFLPDHNPALVNELPYWRWERRGQLEASTVSGTGLARDVDLLLHDAQFDEDRFAQHVDWGHSSIEQAVIFAELVRARGLLLFHHDPEHDDHRIDGLVEDARRLADRARRPLRVVGAADGGEHDVGRELAVSVPGTPERGSSGRPPAEEGPTRGRGLAGLLSADISSLRSAATTSAST